MTRYIFLIRMLKLILKTDYNCERIIKAVAAEVDRQISSSLNDKQCLRRALCIKLVLLTYKINVRMKIGVKINPFSAHAWIESDSFEILEQKQNTLSYSVIYEE